MERYDVLIVGAGVAGISAAKEAYNAGCRNILMVDRKAAFGGVLQQCMHDGFGTNLTGPEYIAQLLADFPSMIKCEFHTTVLRIDADKTAIISHAQKGIQTITFDQIILATGCRETPIGALSIAGTRPEGVYTAGQMQEMMNIYGIVPDGPVAILGGGDMGLIMAAQIAAIGLEVTIIEQKNVCKAMERNQRKLEHLPVSQMLQTTITELYGQRQLEGVKLQNGTYLPCKTLLIAVGLCPDQELVYHLGMREWLHLCGNCNRIHAMVESVVREGQAAGFVAYQQLGGAQ